VELVASFKCPLERNEWALLPYTQLEHLFNLLNVKVSDAQFEEILKIYTEEALDILPRLIETDVRETLLSLKNKYKIALISNTGRTPGSVLRKILDELNLIDVFDALIFSDEVHLRKPNAQIFLLACERLDTKPKETVHIGDSVNIDFLGARDAGLKAIQFLPDKSRSAMHPLVETLKDVQKVIEAYYD
jgi:putative hydrolase of the HAD superfamily